MKPAYLVYDTETIPDTTLFRDIKYPDLTEDEAIEAREKQKGSTFLPPQYHVPVSIAVLKLDANYLPMGGVQTISHPEDPDQGVRLFWQAINTWPLTLVDFNGRGFDLPMLTTWAYMRRISVPSYFSPTSQKSDYRYRYGKKHIDLQDWISGYGPLAGGLKLFSRLAGGLSKEGFCGSMVHEAYLEGRYDEIDEYCREDVRETYRVFLRTRLLMGKIHKEQEEDLLACLR